jgi:hypothetical protein
MQIEEQTAAISSAKEEREDQVGFEFKMVSLEDPKVFPNFKNKDIQERFFKW